MLYIFANELQLQQASYMKKKYFFASTFIISIFTIFLITSSIHHWKCHDEHCEICLILSTQTFILAETACILNKIYFKIIEQFKYIKLFSEEKTLITLKTKQTK